MSSPLHTPRSLSPVLLGSPSSSAFLPLSPEANCDHQAVTLQNEDSKNASSMCNTETSPNPTMVPKENNEEIPDDDKTQAPGHLLSGHFPTLQELVVNQREYPVPIIPRYSLSGSSSTSIMSDGSSSCTLSQDDSCSSIHTEDLDWQSGDEPPAKRRKVSEACREQAAYEWDTGDHLLAARLDNLIADRLELRQLQLESARLGGLLGSLRAERRRRRSWQFALDYNLEIGPPGRSHCRVLAYDSRSCDLYMTQKSTSSLLPGWGVRKVSCVDFRPGQLTLLHSAAIGDAAYSLERDALLTVGLEGCARVSERGKVGLTLKTDAALWSCAWDAAREHRFYLGRFDGVVLTYDIRSPKRPMSRLQSPGRATSVVALHSASQLGLISCCLDSCWLWRARCGIWAAEQLPVEGPFLSMAYDDASCSVLLLCRPRPGLRNYLRPLDDVTTSPLPQPSAGRLVVCRLDTDGAFVVSRRFTHWGAACCRASSVWAGVIAGSGAHWAAAYDTHAAALRLHPLNGALHHSLPMEEPALAVRSVELQGQTILAALSFSRLQLYKAVATGL